jgi:hypothetical protein
MGTSLTEKLNRKRLQDALRRRRAARAVTHLYDHSVPTEMRFHGVSFASRVPGKPAVRVESEHALSPYVIHLNAHVPTPAEWLEESSSFESPNLLLPETFLITLADAERMNPEDDLVLSREEIAGQILEDEFGEGREAARPRGRGEIRLAEENEAAREEPTLVTIEPTAATADLASYFELPEEEIAADVSTQDARENENVVLTFTKEMTIEETVADEVPLGMRPKPQRSFSACSFLPRHWYRAVGVFALTCVAFVVPIHAIGFVGDVREAKAGLESASAAALSQLRAGANAVLVHDAGAASDSFDGAGDAFSRARRTVNDLGALASLLLSAVPAAGDTYRAGTRLIEAGASLSAAGERIADGVVATQSEPNPTPVSRLRLITAYVSSALPDLARAADIVKTIDADDVPAEHRAAFAELANRLPTLVDTVEEFVTFSEMAQTVLGGSGSKRYLLVFQNNTEIRATGGFMGSFAEIDVKDGVITGMRVPGGGTYDLQGSLRHNLAAPEPLQLLTARWEFQDANWFPDFPATARQIMDFYVGAGGGSVDGVVAVNATYVAGLLDLLGPVDMPEYGRTITSENFLAETQKIVELEYDRTENKPKAFIGDLAPLLLERTMGTGPEGFLTMLGRANQGLAARDVQVYFADDALERSVRELGWGGEIKAADGDYLMLVNSNLGGGKTDGVIGEKVDVAVSVDEAGGITDTVTVTRTHFGEPGAAFSGVNNVNYVRLYVPAGSTLLSASGFTPPDASLYEFAPDDYVVDDDLLYAMDTLAEHGESGTAVYEEFGKTVFGNWTQTKPGTSTTYSFTYRLPFVLDRERPEGMLAATRNLLGAPATAEYTIAVQKQSGITDRDTRVSMVVPDAFAPIWTSHDLSGTTFNNAKDAFMGALFEMQTDL